MCEKTWPISKRGELEIGLEFERNGFDDRKNFSKGSFKRKKDTQVIRVQEQQYCCFTPTAMYRQYDRGREITRDTIIEQIIIAMLSYKRYIAHPYIHLTYCQLQWRYYNTVENIHNASCAESTPRI